MLSRKTFLLLILYIILGIKVSALDTTQFEDEFLQQRYQALTNELRCLVCQNETIAGSSSELAQDLRKQVAEQIKSGKNDADIRLYMTERYGDFILYRPPNTGSTKLLWLAPLGFLFILSLIFILVVSNKSNLDTQKDEEIE